MVDEHAFHGSPLSESDRRVVLDRFEFDRTLAAFDGTTPVGVTMCFSFQLSVPGQEVLPAAGVTFVAVLPTHRRRGVLSSMMRRQLADVRDRGEPLADPVGVGVGDLLQVRLRPRQLEPRLHAAARRGHAGHDRAPGSTAAAACG